MQKTVVVHEIHLLWPLLVLGLAVLAVMIVGLVMLLIRSRRNQ